MKLIPEEEVLVRTAKIYDGKKAVLLKLLLEPEDVPENIGGNQRQKQAKLTWCQKVQITFLKTFVIQRKIRKRIITIF